MDALSVRVSSVKKKTGGVPGPTCTSANLLVQTPNKGKSLDISKKKKRRMILGSPHTN